MTGRTADFLVAADRTRIEIILAIGSSQPVRMKEPGLRHLAFVTDNFDADYERIKAAGVNVLSGPDAHGGNRMVFFEDPDGNVMHLIQRATPLV